MLKAILRGIASLTMATPKNAAPLVLPAGAGAKRGKTAEVPIFINLKALTFPILVGLIKGAWAAVSLLPVAWATSVFGPLIMALVLGILIAISNLL
jgi:hypothetical protein